MTDGLESRRAAGEDAKALLANPILAGAFQTLEARYIAEWMSSGYGDIETRESAYQKLASLRDFLRELDKTVSDGLVADHELRARARDE